MPIVHSEGNFPTRESVDEPGERPTEMKEDNGTSGVIWSCGTLETVLRDQFDDPGDLLIGILSGESAAVAECVSAVAS